MPGGYAHQRHASLVRWLATFHHLSSALDVRRRLPPLVLLRLLRIQECPPDRLLWLLPQVGEDVLDLDGHPRPPLQLKFPLGISPLMLLSPNPLPLPLTLDLSSPPSPPLSRLPLQWNRIETKPLLLSLHTSDVLSPMNIRIRKSFRRPHLSRWRPRSSRRWSPRQMTGSRTGRTMSVPTWPQGWPSRRAGTSSPWMKASKSTVTYRSTRRPNVLEITPANSAGPPPGTP